MGGGRGKGNLQWAVRLRTLLSVTWPWPSSKQWSDATNFTGLQRTSLWWKWKVWVYFMLKLNQKREISSPQKGPTMTLTGGATPDEHAFLLSGILLNRLLHYCSNNHMNTSVPLTHFVPSLPFKNTSSKSRLHCAHLDHKMIMGSQHAVTGLNLVQIFLFPSQRPSHCLLLNAIALFTWKWRSAGSDPFTVIKKGLLCCYSFLSSWVIW